MTSESMCPRARAPQQEKPLQQEACTLQLEHSPCLPQREEGPHTGAKTQHSEKFKNEVYSFVALSTVMFLCNHPNIHSQNSFHFAKTEILSPSAPPQSLATTILLSVSMNLTAVGSLQKQNYTVFVLL